MRSLASTLANFPFKTLPDPHQLEILQRTADLPAYALLWEMGVAKTKPMIDNIALLYLQGKINGALIVTLNGVDLNWLIDEIPKHLADSVKKESRIFRFSTKKSKTNYHKEEIKWLLQHPQLAWLIMSYDAWMTMEGKEAAIKFLEKRECFYVLDESAAIKTPGAKRTMRIVRTAHRAKYRRILDGYPTPNGAFDIYSQLKFLDEDFWLRHGWGSFTAFKSYFGVFEQAFGKNAVEFEKLVGFQHLDELKTIVSSISSRLLKKDTLNLPEKIYLPRYFELSAKQRELYSQLEDEFRIWLDADTLITANLAMVRMLRLQQISCGYLPTGEDEPVHYIEGKNPRLELLDETLDALPQQKCIIWARYRLDIKLIAELLTKRKYNFVMYTGETDDEDRIKAKETFQNGDAQYFLGTPAAAGIGLTLHAAKNSIYYSNSFNLRHRKQSEDRVHRRGLIHPANYIDLLGVNTIDKHIMQNLCNKMSVSDAILGDTAANDIRTQLKDWLEE